MSLSSTAESEQQRLEALERFGIDLDADLALDGLASLAALICGTPIALVTIVEASHQWTKARFGAEPERIAREHAFCAHAIRSDEVLVVPDTLLDARFAQNPFVTGSPSIRFYAGAPLVGAGGWRFGALCVMDHHPRNLEAGKVEILRILSRHVMTHLELRREISLSARQSRSDELRVAMSPSVVSHGLRTPLTSIRGSLALLASGYAGELPPAAREMLAIAERNSVRLGSFIEDMLEERSRERAKI